MDMQTLQVIGLLLVLVIVLFWCAATAYLWGQSRMSSDTLARIDAAEQAAMRERLRADRALDRLASVAGIPPVSEAGLLEAKEQKDQADRHSDEWAETWADEV